MKRLFTSIVTMCVFGEQNTRMKQLSMKDIPSSVLGLRTRFKVSFSLTKVTAISICSKTDSLLHCLTPLAPKGWRFFRWKYFPPMEWSERSPRPCPLCLASNLYVCDFFLWGYLRDITLMTLETEQQSTQWMMICWWILWLHWCCLCCWLWPHWTFVKTGNKSW